MLQAIASILPKEYIWQVFLKTGLIGFVLFLWTLYVQPYALSFLMYGQWFLAKVYYPFITYETADFILQTAIFFSSLKIFIWIVSENTQKDPVGFEHSDFNEKTEHTFRTTMNPKRRNNDANMNY